MFSYDATVIDEKQPLSLNVKDVPIHVALYEMFKSTPIKYTINGNKILLEPNDNGANPSQNKVEKMMKVSGTVVDHSGTPVIGATVLIQGSVKGTTTDVNGKYSLVAPKNSVLVFRYIGYYPVEKKVLSSNLINVTLEDNNVNLKDVVVVAYGLQKKEDVVSSISSVSGD